MLEWHLPAELVFWVTQLASPLHARLAWRLLPLVGGLLFAQGSRTVTSWLRAAGIGPGFQRYYYFLGSLGRKTEVLAALLLRRALTVVPLGERVLLGLDDTPTARYGPHVQGAGIHHNPTPGPAGGPFVYGHVWVVLAALARHPDWGMVALPLLARLYVRAKDLASIDPWHRPAFRTKLELAVELLRWAKSWMGHWCSSLWVVTDGAYAKAA